MRLFLTLLLSISIIPLPDSVKESEGQFVLDARTAVVARDAAFDEVAADFRTELAVPAGFELRPRVGLFGKAVVLKRDASLADEAYTLKVGRRRVVVKASGAAGAFYGLQTFRQLLPEQIYSKEPEQVEWTAQCCSIEDAPRVGYRGMQLDCCRYFYDKETVKALLDEMAIHKQNFFHWHLTDDQGWRIEIKKYPLLTEVGAWRAETAGYAGSEGNGTPHGGFYSQDDIREIVEYARHRQITVIPEIELPGHASAAIAAYPWLSCTPDEPKAVATQWGVKKDVFCPSPETFKFLEDVFDEVVELFPSPIYHIGGDECPKDAWRASGYCHHLADSLGLSGVEDLQYYFVKHFDSYLREKGKRVIGWDEILDGSAVESTIVMSYRGHNPAIKAMERGMNVILCPNRYCYYDYRQDWIEDHPKNHHLFITLRKAYNYNPGVFIPDSLMRAKGDLILGYQACLWGEYIPDAEQLENQAYPRIAAISEFCWTDDDKRDFDDFNRRMIKEFGRLDARGIRYNKAYFNVVVNMGLEKDYPRYVSLDLNYPLAKVHYTTDGSEPVFESPLAPVDSFLVNKGDVISARGFMDDGTPVGEPVTRVFGEPYVPVKWIDSPNSWHL